MNNIISNISSINPNSQVTLVKDNDKKILINKIINQDITKFSSKKGLKRLPPSTQHALIVAINCVQNINIESPERIGIFVGNSLGYIENVARFMGDAIFTSAKYVSPLAFPNTVLNSISGWISIVLGITGVNMTINTGKTSSLDALKIANDYINYGVIDKAIVVTSEEVTETIIESDLYSSNHYSESASAILIEKRNNNGRSEILIKNSYSCNSNSNTFVSTLEKELKKDIRESVVIFTSENLSFEALSDVVERQNIQVVETFTEFGESFSSNGFQKINMFIKNRTEKIAYIVEANAHGNYTFVKLCKG